MTQMEMFAAYQNIFVATKEQLGDTGKCREAYVVLMIRLKQRIEWRWHFDGTDPLDQASTENYIF